MIERPPILKDQYFIECISQAILSKGEQERYGSILVKNNRILGRGFNRAIANGFFKLERIIRQGYANHAEIEAMNDALMKDHNISGSSIYVAGYFPETGILFFKKLYTCNLCPYFMKKYQIADIYNPMPRGWKVNPLDAAIHEAEQFKGDKKHEKRLEILVGDYSIDLIKDKLKHNI